MADLLKPVAFSVLDLAPILAGATPTDTFRNSLRLAQAVEQQGYTRYWLSEHHNMASVASSSPSVIRILIGILQKKRKFPVPVSRAHT